MIDFPRDSRILLWALAAAFCVAGTLGCAGGLPRIDPTGQQLLIWPSQQPVIGPPSPFATAPPLPGTPQMLGPAVPQPVLQPSQPFPAGPPVMAAAPQPLFGNLQAPPAYPSSGPPGLFGQILPQSQPPVIGPPVGPPMVGTPAPVGGPIASPVIVAPASVVLTVPPERVRLTPGRVLAPVGSEVVLRAGVCNSEGYLIASQRIDWMLARDGSGQFVTLNNRDELHPFRLPRDKPRKVDNWYAIGKTSTYPTCLDRGTADPRDDVQVLRGESWITVSSASEGTSHVTAYSPIVENWPGRTASATIYWVDAQWVFPPSAVAQPGANHILTTCVSRRSDGAPLAGWIVRYDVATSGGATLGYEATQSLEVQTDANGQASVEVSPANTGSGVAVINSTLLRPAQAGGSPSPPLEIGRSIATITWGGGAAVLPLPAGSPYEPAPYQPAPYQPLEPSPGDAGPPVTQTPPQGRAELDVQIGPPSLQQAYVGDYARFEVVVTNRGNAYARGIAVRDEFDLGLSHVGAQQGALAIDYGRTPDLAPGERHVVPLDLQVLRAGRLCHTVTATTSDGATARATSCITAVERPRSEPQPPLQPLPQQFPAAQPSLEVTLVSPERQFVGETASIRIRVANTGSVPLTNLLVVKQFDPALEPRLAESGYQWRTDNSMQWQIPRLEAGGVASFGIQSLCVTANPDARISVLVTADGGVRQARESRVEILQPPAGVAPVGPPQTQQPPETLRLSIRSSQNPAEVGRRAQIFATVANVGTQPGYQVGISILLPLGMTAVQDGIEPRQQFSIQNQANGQVISFSPIAEVRAGESINILIPVDVHREGDVLIHGNLTVGGYAGSRSVQEPIRINPRLGLD